MQRKMLFVLLFLAALLVSSDGFAGMFRSLVPAQTPMSAPILAPGNQTPSLKTVRESIGAAASRRSWQVIAEQPGLVQLRTSIRGKHEITVIAYYDTRNVRIEYYSTVNLLAGKRDGIIYIHPTYNDAVGALLREIVVSVETSSKP